MNVKEYISTGAIESYVLGLCTDAERQELEALCAQYPEIAQAKDRFEQSLEETLLREAVAPPAGLKAQVKQSIESGISTGNYTSTHDTEETPVRRLDPWKWVAAASIILLAGVAFWGISTNNKLQSLRASATENETLQRELNETKAQLTELRSDAASLQRPGLKLASLNRVPTAPVSSAQVTVFWDTTSKDVFLMVNNLPKPATDQQYQLWALLNGQPVDLGVFEVKEEKLVVKMKNTQGAQAFAITLEPKGGSPSPTMSSMYVYGDL